MLDRAGNRLLVVALLATLVLWNVPYGWVALYPFKIFATWLHEGSHGIVMLLTGAGVAQLEIFRDTSGLAHPARGVGVAAHTAIASAGYLGTALFGAAFLVLGRTERGGRTVLAVLGGLMLVSVAAFVRNLFGVVAVGTLGAALLVIAFFAAERVCAFTVSFLAAQSCINAVLDIRVLFGSTFYVNGQPHAGSDADTVAQLVGGPAWVWASLWLLWSFALFYVALRLVAPERVTPATPDLLALPMPAPGYGSGRGDPRRSRDRGPA